MRKRCAMTIGAVRCNGPTGTSDVAATQHNVLISPRLCSAAATPVRRL